MLVVSDTSPISNLAIIGRLDLLRERYGSVLVPPAVKSELDSLSHPSGRKCVQNAFFSGWLKVEPLPDAAALVLPTSLDPGESEAIQLCPLPVCRQAHPRRRLGTRRGARAWSRVYRAPRRTRVAKYAGKVPSVKAEIARLRSKARFFVSAEFEAIILAGAGE